MPVTLQPYVLPILLLIPAGLFVVLGVWRRPALGVAGVVALIAVPFRSGEESQAFAHLTLPDLAAVLMVGIVALRTLTDEGFAAEAGTRLHSWVILPLVGVLVAGTAVTFTATDATASVSGLIRYTEIFVVVPLGTYLALRSRADLKLVLAVVVALGVFEGTVGAYQFFTGTGASYGELNSRAVGTFGAYNIISMSTVVTYAILAGVALFAGLRDVRRTWGLVLVAALLPPLAFSFSRGAWIATVVGFFVILVLSGWRRYFVILALAGLLALFALTPIVSATLQERSDPLSRRAASILSSTSASSADQSVRTRYSLWQAAGEMWADHPFTGVGLKNFALFRDSYASASLSTGSDIADPSGGFRRVELLSPHSLYFLILAEQGLLGALAYGVFFLSLGFAAFYRIGNFGKTSAERVFGLFVSGFLVSYLAGSIYEDLGGSTTLLNAELFGCLLWLASGTEPDEEVSA